jgi:transposase
MEEEYDIYVVAPHKKNRVKPATQDGRTLRRHKRRWKVERTFAWLHNFRRLVVRWEKKSSNFLSFIYLAVMKIMLNRL